jgi:hypothetical protein
MNEPELEPMDAARQRLVELLQELVTLSDQGKFSLNVAVDLVPPATGEALHALKQALAALSRREDVTRLEATGLGEE